MVPPAKLFEKPRQLVLRFFKDASVDRTSTSDILHCQPYDRLEEYLFDEMELKYQATESENTTALIELVSKACLIAVYKP